MADDPMREQMVEALAGWLGKHVEAIALNLRERPLRSQVDLKKVASHALDVVWAATADVRTGTPPSWQPDLNDPGQALARRVQAALEREFEGEDLFPCVVVVQENASRRIGFAATAIDMGEVDHLLMLGRGAARRSVRQHGEAP